MLAIVLLITLAEGDEAAARAVLSDLVKAAQANHKSSAPKKGSHLTSLLVQAAATSAQKQPEARRVPAFLLAIGIGLDTSDLMRRNLVTGAAWKRIEPEKERKERLRVLGKPELHGRQDLAQHFAVSCGLVALVGPKQAEMAGLLKELLDARPGGSGFSFADLAADYSGVAFAEWLKAKPSRLADVTALEPFCLPPKGLKEGLTLEAFNTRYGGVMGTKFLAASKLLREQIAALNGYR